MASKPRARPPARVLVTPSLAPVFCSLGPPLLVLKATASSMLMAAMSFRNSRVSTSIWAAMSFSGVLTRLPASELVAT